MANLAFEFRLVAVFDMSLVSLFDLLISASGHKVARGIIELFTLEYNLGLALFDMILNCTLTQINLAYFALNYDLVVKLHQNSVWAFNLSR